METLEGTSQIRGRGQESIGPKGSSRVGTCESNNHLYFFEVVLIKLRLAPSKS